MCQRFLHSISSGRNFSACIDCWRQSVKQTQRPFLVFGYAIFLFMHLDLVAFVTPDMLLSTIVYCLAGLTVEMKLSGSSLRRSCLLGILLGAGFLMKAVMLPLAPSFLSCA